MITYIDGFGFFSDSQIRETLQNHKIYCKPVGVTRQTRQKSAFVDPPYFIDQYSLAFIHENKLVKIEGMEEEKVKRVMESKEYGIYKKLKPHFFLTCNSKFGSLFLAYRDNPQEKHAEYLVFSQGKLVEIGRLAGIANKKCLFVDSDTLQMFQIIHEQ